jgi:ankyrin repeat protein
LGKNAGVNINEEGVEFATFKAALNDMVLYEKDLEKLKEAKENFEKLVNAGFDLNLSDKMGFTNLHYATKNGNVDIVEAMIKAGAQANLENNEGLEIG